jgi:hypothetical protein
VIALPIQKMDKTSGKMKKTMSMTILRIKNIVKLIFSYLVTMVMEKIDPEEIMKISVRELKPKRKIAEVEAENQEMKYKIEEKSKESDKLKEESLKKKLKL